MKGIRRFRDRLEKDLQSPSFKKAFEKEEVFAEIAIQIAKFRENEGLSQAELAKKLHTTQQTVSRLEDLENTSYSVQTLIRLAQVFHKKLTIKFG